VTAQILGRVNVTKRKNLPLQIWTLKKRRDKAALIWPCRRVRVLALHSYPSAPLARGFFCCRRLWRPKTGASTPDSKLFRVMLQLGLCRSLDENKRISSHTIAWARLTLP
jgi:hypothetical protein